MKLEQFTINLNLLVYIKSRLKRSILKQVEWTIKLIIELFLFNYYALIKKKNLLNLEIVWWNDYSKRKQSLKHDKVVSTFFVGVTFGTSYFNLVKKLI